MWQKDQLKMLVFLFPFVLHMMLHCKHMAASSWVICYNNVNNEQENSNYYAVP
jgi:TRAP-type mannitol/chloroaromatic compound transport system permease small subunit